MCMAEHARVTGCLQVKLIQWPEGKPVWKGFLHWFTEAGGELAAYVKGHLRTWESES